MKNPNITQINQIKKQEQQLSSVYFGSYLINGRKFLAEQLADIWEDLSGEKVNRTWSCSSCMFNFYKRVAEWWFNRPTEKPATEPKNKKQKTIKKNAKPSKTRAASKQSQEGRNT